MNRALRFTLLGLAVVVVLFAVTWFSLPASDCGNSSVPARLFDRGLTFTGHNTFRRSGLPFGPGFKCVRLHDLKTRVVVFYGSLAAVIVLVGLAFGAGRRQPSTA